ncbi:MAG: hypothetical protein ACI399_04655 [Candidatus Cryptobacteroides sp.]
MANLFRTSAILAAAVALNLLWPSCTPGAVSSGPHRYQNPAGDEFPVMAWFTLHGPHLDTSHFEALRDAGFNLAFSFLSDLEEVDRVLEGAKGSGVKLIVNCKELREDPAGTVAHLKDNPDVAGYFLRDEPGADDFASLHEWAESIRGIDDTKLLYLNLHPTYAPASMLQTDSYEEYVSRFCDEVPLGWLSFDHYPVLQDKIRPDYYRNLEVISSNAGRKGIPFWAFVLSTAHGPYPVATYESMCMQAYSNLAYGAQGIEYFTFQPGKVNSVVFHDAPVDSAGARTEVFCKVKKVNDEIHSLTPVFLGAEVINVGHTGDLPEGTEQFIALPRQISALEYEGEGFLVSHLRNGRSEYLLLVNRSLSASQKISLDILSPKVSRILPCSEPVRLGKGLHEDVLEPGNMLLYRLK